MLDNFLPRRRYGRSVPFRLAFTAILLFLGAQSFAASPHLPQDGAAAPSIDDRASLAAFVDGLIGGQMAEFRIPSAAIAVVRDGRILFTKSYGYADRRRKSPIDPETGMVRLASITKVFTETAVLQLVETGKLDLDRDVKLYLKGLRIPATFDTPVTLRHLLTHTAGFEESVFGHGRVRDPAQAVVTADYLRRHMPARVRPPGRMHSYSNYGIALAGLIVEQVSGEPYAQYVDRHIFRPLGMAHTTAETPVPPRLQPYLVQGYAYEEGRYVPRPFEMHAFTPAGSASASMNDVARFMIALLPGGRNGNILNPGSTRQLLAGGFRADPRLTRNGLGLFGRTVNGVHVAGHTGDTGLFHNYLLLLPQQDIGIFLVYMGDDGVTARETFLRAFFDRYFPVAKSRFEPAVGDAPAEHLAGQYALIRRNHEGIEKLPMTWGAMLTVRGLADGQLLASWPALGWEWRLARGRDGRYHDVEGQEAFVFRTNADGEADYVLADFLPFLGFEPLRWYERPGFWLPMLGFCALLFLSILLGMPGRLRKLGRERGTVWWAIAGTGFMAGWAILSVGGVAAAFLNNPADHVSIAVKIALVAPILFVLMALAVAIMLVLSWRNPGFGLRSRVHHALAVAAAVILSAFFYQWNLLGWHFS